MTFIGRGGSSPPFRTISSLGISPSMRWPLLLAILLLGAGCRAASSPEQAFDAVATAAELGSAMLELLGG